MNHLRMAAKRVLSGREAASLVTRFDLHIMAVVPLLLLAAAGAVARSTAEIRARHDMPATDLEWLIGAGNAAGIAAAVLGGYLLLAATIWLVQQLFAFRNSAAA